MHIALYPDALDWTDNHFISETFDAICTPGVTDWLQAETGLDYRPPVHGGYTAFAGESSGSGGTGVDAGYSQVEYDQHGVNELWGDFSKAYKKWGQSERLERMIDQREELESKVTGDQIIHIPYSLLKDFREAGFYIDYHLSGNAVDDDNNPQTGYAQKSEHARLNYTELKRLKFIAKAK